MNNGSTGQTPTHEPAEAALMQEFASYLAHLASSFAQPLSDRLNGHEREITGRIKKLAEEIERQRAAAAERHAADEAVLIAKVKALADEIERHRVRVLETQDTLMHGLATTVAPLQEVVGTSMAAFNERAGQVVGEFAATEHEVAMLSKVVGKTRAAVWVSVVLSLASLVTTLWIGLR